MFLKEFLASISINYLVLLMAFIIIILCTLEMLNALHIRYQEIELLSLHNLRPWMFDWKLLYLFPKKCKKKLRAALIISRCYLSRFPNPIVLYCKDILQKRLALDKMIDEQCIEKKDTVF